MTPTIAVNGAVEGSLPSKEGPALELYLAEEALTTDHPLLVCEHLPKAAGSSLRRAIELNYKKGGARRFSVSRSTLGANPTVPAEAVTRFFAALGAESRERVLCIAGPGASGAVVGLDRPHRCFTVVREPVDRTAACFFFAGRARGIGLADFLRAHLDGRSVDPFAPPGGPFFNGQARQLLAPFHDVRGLVPTDGPPADADDWRARLFAVLDDSYLVGLRDRFAESLELFAASFAWKRLEYPRLRVNPARSQAAALSPEAADLARRCNWLDAEIYERCRSRFDDAIAALGAPDEARASITTLGKGEGMRTRRGVRRARSG